MLTEWDFEMKKLEPQDLIHVPDIDLDQFNEPFTNDMNLAEN